jgi:glycosyltransferase involved in cell wall biosynthesis
MGVKWVPARIDFVKQAFHERFNPDEEYLGFEKHVNHIKPVVSVCVPAYQHEHFIAECLDSILLQKTNFPIEILVGEDDSPDHTRAICKEYAEKYPDKIRLFLRDRETSQLYDEEGHYLFRFNVKWLRVSARGKYIALCEGDDYWLDPYKLQKQVDFMESHPAFSMCFHNAKVIYEEQSESHNFVDIPEGEYKAADIYENHIVATGSVLFKSECIQDKEQFYNNNFFFGDIVLFLTMAECGKVWFFEDVMSVYRKHEGGMMHRAFEKPENVRRFIIHHKEIQKTFSKELQKISHRHISWFYFILFRVTFKDNLFESISSFMTSLYYSPGQFLERMKIFLQTRLKAFKKS